MHDWGQTLRQNPRFRERQARLECEASLSVALGYRDLKPPLVGTCSLPGAPQEDRYQRLLHDIRSNRTDSLGREALQAVKSLRVSIDALEAELSRQSPQFASLVRPVHLEDISTRLLPREVLIEFVRWSGRYGAFLLEHSGGLRWVDLGPAAPVDRAVQNLIAAANDWSIATAAHETLGAASARQTAQDALRMLSERLRPVTAALSGAKRLRVVPDGPLNLVPFGALSDSRGRYLVERFAISYVSAGRDLVGAPNGGSPSTGPAVIAVSPGAGELRLEDAELEARDLQRWLPHAQVLGEGRATEDRIMHLAHPAILHIIGHGVVRGYEDCRIDPGGAACNLAGLDPAARVMSLSAILLEEFYGRGASSRQDGLLTALELETVDLQGTELLVLSQCRMADGLASAGEGVYGMRRAAAIAGVNTFVAPLWRVEDAAQRLLMNRFYSELHAGRDRAEALRQAQLELLHAPRTSSFLYWAPVILSGDSGRLPESVFTE